MVNQENVTDSWCPSWGLAMHPAAPGARDMIVAALVRELDNNLDRNIRRNCVQGLGRHGGDAAKKKLQKLAEKEENEEIRREAAEALKRVG